jgi:hypothetical protein
MFATESWKERSASLVAPPLASKVKVSVHSSSSEVFSFVTVRLSTFKPSMPTLRASKISSAFNFCFVSVGSNTSAFLVTKKNVSPLTVTAYSLL